MRYDERMSAEVLSGKWKIIRTIRSKFSLTKKALS